MDVLISTQSNWVIITARGRIDSFNFEFLSNRLATVKRACARKVAVDLTAVNTINIAAARLLVKNARSLKEKGSRMAIITVDPRIIDILNFFSEENELEIHQSRERTLADV